MRKQCTMILAALLVTITTFASIEDSLKAQMIRDWQRAKVYTKAYLDAMPADKYNHRPDDSIRTFAQQMLHLAAGNVGIINTATGKERIPIGRENSASAQTRDSVVYYVMASYDFAINAVQNMDFSKLWEVVKRGNIAETRYAWLQKVFEHQTHHRGQCTIYIRTLGIEPPNEMLF